jgi:predicted amidohydrolase
MTRIAGANPHPPSPTGNPTSPNRVAIALANLRFPSSPDDSVAQAVSAISAISAASAAHADILCFPECFVPGYRTRTQSVPPPDAAFLTHAHQTIAAAAGRANIAVILGTERIVNDALLATALVIDRDGTILGFQDKVQLAPQEEGTYTPGQTRHIFRSGDLTFGISICHEGWRYPETVRWPVRNGAQVVFHPHFHGPEPNAHSPEPDAYRPTTFADPANTIFEKTMLCRAAENTCYFASVNFAIPGSDTTSAIINPDGTVLAWQPYGVEGLLIATLDLTAATGLYAHRLKPTLLSST